MEDLLKTVKFNCDISDATYWGYFSICGLLMRMRDLYRSEHGLKPWQPIPKEDIMKWISEKEAVWKRLEGMPLKPVEIGNQLYNPFNLTEINQIISANGYVYGAGYSLHMKPSFFVAELSSRYEFKDYTVYISKRELARDLLSSSAMLQGRCIFIRLDSLKSFLWERLSNLHTRASPELEAIFSKYELSAERVHDETFETRLENLASRYSEMLLSHEIAEAVEDIPEWIDLITSLKDRKLEFLLRALKDIIADTSDYGPIKTAIEKQDIDMIKLYTGFIGEYRLIIESELTSLSRVEDLNIIDQKRYEIYSKLCRLRDNIVSLFKENRIDLIKKTFESFLRL